MSTEKFIPPQGSDDSWEFAKYGLLAAIAVGTVGAFIWLYQKTNTLQAENTELQKDSAQEKERTATELKSLQDENKELSSKNQALSDENQTLKTEKQQAVSAQDKLEQEKKELSNKLSTQEEHNNSLQEKNKTLEQQKNLLETKNSSLMSEKTTSETKFSKQIEDHQTQIATQEEKIKQLERQAEKDKSAIEIERQTNQNLLSLQEKYEVNLKNSSPNLEQNAKVQTLETKLKKQTEESESKIKLLEEELNSKKQDIEKLSQENLKQKKEIDDLKKSVEQLQMPLKSEKNMQAPPLPERKTSTKKSNAETIKQMGTFSNSAPTQQHASQAMQAEDRSKNTKMQIMAKLFEKYKDSHPSEQLFIKLLIFLFAYHENDKTVKDIITEAKTILSDKNIKENDLSNHFPNTAQIIAEASSIEDTIVTPTSKKPNQDQYKYHIGFKSGNADLHLVLDGSASNVFGTLLSTDYANPCTKEGYIENFNRKFNGSLTYTC